jgi:hypothetical protein
MTEHKASNSLIPEDIVLKPADTLMKPATIDGDGNCLPRCLSTFAYGHPDNYQEMRTRIIYELVCNRDLYIIDHFLRSGNPDAVGDIAVTFASYSEVQYMGRLTHPKMCQIFMEEIMKMRHEGAYMGIWQIAAAANVLHRPVVSVYPLYGGHTVRKDLNRVFLPTNTNKKYDDAVHILWTRVWGKSNIKAAKWNPNHFVTLLPDKPKIIEVDFEVFLHQLHEVN